MVTTYLRRVYSSFAAHVFDIPPRLLSFLLLSILLVLPLTGLNPYIISIMTSANVLAIFASSWDLLVGRTGQMSLGHAIFFGVGAYATALLFKSYSLPLWITIPLATAIGATLGLLIGFPCLRTKGPYLVLVSMAFPIILSSIVYFFDEIFGGEYGVRGLPSFFPASLTNEQRITGHYYLTLLVLFATAVILYKIANSHTGVVFISILDDELAAKASGINVTKYKLMAFTISGLFASLAGAIYAHIISVANPPLLSLTWSFIPVIVTFLGGIGTIYGPILGAYVYYLLDRYVLTILIEIPYDYIYIRLLIFTLIVAILVIKWPRGLARFATDKLEDLQEEREIEEIIAKREKKKKKSLPRS